MAPNILVTGGAGYIGGSVIASFLNRTDGPIKAASIIATVRSEQQVQALSKLGVKALLMDLADKTAVTDAVIGNEIDVVVNTGPSFVPSLATNIIRALGQRRKFAGTEVYYVHSSVATLFTEDAGWKYGEVRDDDAGVLEKEKEIGGPHPVRLTNVLVFEEAEIHEVTAFNVVVPMVYGRGTGEGRKLSVNIPAHVRTSVKNKKVYKFERDGNPQSIHISDLADLYTILVEKILQKESIPSGKQGYYFAVANRAPWWTTMERISESLHARGLVAEPTVETWPSYEVAAENLGWPPLYVRAMGTAFGDLVPVNATRIGWQPKWDEKQYLNNLDDEVQSVLELDNVQSNLFDALMTTPQKS